MTQWTACQHAPSSYLPMKSQGKGVLTRIGFKRNLEVTASVDDFGHSTIVSNVETTLSRARSDLNWNAVDWLDICDS